MIYRVAFCSFFKTCFLLSASNLLLLLFLADDDNPPDCLLRLESVFQIFHADWFSVLVTVLLIF